MERILFWGQIWPLQSRWELAGRDDWLGGKDKSFLLLFLFSVLMEIDMCVSV